MTSSQPGPYGPPSAGYQPPQTPPTDQRPKKKRRIWLWVAIAVVLLFGGCIAIASQGSQQGTGTSPAPANPAAPATSAPPPAQAAAGIGQPVRDGKFEFTVTKVEPGKTRVGNDTIGETAQGQFVFVHVTVKNIGDQAQLFDGSSQKVFDAQGREFSADTAAAIYLDKSQSFLNQINPGNSVNGIVIFDVPRDVKPVRIELHDSPFSGGVTVALS